MKKCKDVNKEFPNDRKLGRKAAKHHMKVCMKEKKKVPFCKDLLAEKKLIISKHQKLENLKPETKNTKTRMNRTKKMNLPIETEKKGGALVFSDPISERTARHQGYVNQVSNVTQNSKKKKTHQKNIPAKDNQNLIKNKGHLSVLRERQAKDEAEIRGCMSFLGKQRKTMSFDIDVDLDDLLTDIQEGTMDHSHLYGKKILMASSDDEFPEEVVTAVNNEIPRNLKREKCSGSKEANKFLVDNAHHITNGTSNDSIPGSDSEDSMDSFIMDDATVEFESDKHCKRNGRQVIDSSDESIEEPPTKRQKRKKHSRKDKGNKYSDEESEYNELFDREAKEGHDIQEGTIDHSNLYGKKILMASSDDEFPEEVVAAVDNEITRSLKREKCSGSTEADKFLVDNAHHITNETSNESISGSDSEDSMDSFIVDDATVEFESDKHCKRNGSQVIDSSDESIEEAPTKRLKRKKHSRKDKGNKYSDEDEESEYNELFDLEAEEGQSDTCSDEEVDEEEELMFAGGSAFSSMPVAAKLKSCSIFDLYDVSSDETNENNDSDLEDFIVNDSDDYGCFKEGSVLEKLLKEDSEGFPKRRRRIIETLSDDSSEHENMPMPSRQQPNCEDSNTNYSLKQKQKKKKKANKVSSKEELEIFPINGSAELKGNFETTDECTDDQKINKKIKKKAIIKKQAKMDGQPPNCEDRNNNYSLEQNQKKKVKQVSFKEDLAIFPINGSTELKSNLEQTYECTDSEEYNDAKNDLHEDIYGRVRDKFGNVIESKKILGEEGKYIPPAQRKLLALGVSAENKEQLLALSRRMKGLLNRLAESNMAGIVSEITMLYNSYTRNDLNATLTKLIFEAIVSPVLTPERLVQEYAFLIAVLSANVGSEVGGHILTEFVIEWVEKLAAYTPPPTEHLDTKQLDNMLAFISQMFNFQVVTSKLLFDILLKLSENIHAAKEVDLILLVLRSVGFTLRKSDPLALKKFIFHVQKIVPSLTKDEDHKIIYSRITFMQEILKAIKNNDVAKIPKYDPTHVQYLRSQMKSMGRKGCSYPELNVSLNDIVKSKLVGRWWVVGSAWSNGLKENHIETDEPVHSQAAPYLHNLLNCSSEGFRKKAQKLKLSRPPLINIFYVLSEGCDDYVDSFEKLLQLNLLESQKPKIFNVLLYLCQKCIEYDPFFTYVAGKFCAYDRKYKRMFEFALWDKFKEIESIRTRYSVNLAHLITDLIAEEKLNLAVFKPLPVKDSQVKVVNFFRQCLSNLILTPVEDERIVKVFLALWMSPKFNGIRETIRVFLKMFFKSKLNDDDHNKRVILVLNIVTKEPTLL